MCIRLYLGAVAVLYKDDTGWVPIEEFQRYVALPESGAAIDTSVPHDINAETLRDAQPFANECGPAFARFIVRNAGTRHTIVVGHNAKRYDHRLLVFHGWNPPNVPSQAGLRFADSLDWLRVAHANLPSYSIKVREFSARFPPPPSPNSRLFVFFERAQNLFASFFKEPVPAAHSAVPDCYALIRLLNHGERVQPLAAASVCERWANIRGRCLKKTGQRNKSFK